MSRNFGRVVTVEVGTPGARPIRLSSRDSAGDIGFRISADVRRTSEATPDQCELRMFGASDALRAALQQDGAICKLLAGLGSSPSTPRGNPVQLFAGKVIPASVDGPRRSAGDRILTWSVTDGGYDLSDVVVRKSWRGPVLISRVIDDVISTSGLTRGAIVLGEPSAQYRTSYHVADRLRVVLDRLARATGSRVSIQHGAVEMWPVGAPRPGRGYMVRPSTGLIEEPSRIDVTRWSVRSILLPGLRPGDAADVRSSFLNGTMVTEDVSHALDSHDGPWETTVAGQVTE